MNSLKVIPSGHSSATWCYMVNASMWRLLTSARKKWCIGFHFRNNKESHTFQRGKPLILQHDVDTDVSLSYLSGFSINQHSLLSRLITKKVRCFP